MRAGSVKTAALALGIALAATVSASTSVRADAPGDAIVARVGDRVITVREVERRIAQVPPFQLRSFGRTPEEIRRQFVSSVLVRELLLSQGALAERLDARPEVEERIRDILRSAILGQIRRDTGTGSAVTDEEVRAYYEQNQERFRSPPRLALWRILVATRAEAEAILGDLGKDVTPKRWNEIARERSLDKATSMRGGNLGFVTPDGATAEPGLKVDPRLVEAASRVKDAEIVSEPVPEGERFAVVWRRQSMKAVNRTLEQEAPSIRQVIAHNKAEVRVKELLEQLRKQQLREHNPEYVDLIDISSTGDLQPVKRPGTLPSSRRPNVASPAPRPSDMR